MNNNGNSDNLLYHLIAQDQWDRLTPIFKAMKKFMPPAALAMTSIAETVGGEIAASVTLQMVSYLGPLYLNPKFHGKVDYSALKAPIDDVFRQCAAKPLIIQGYVALTADQEVAHIAEAAGMIRKPEAIVLVQEFGSEHTLIG